MIEFRNQKELGRRLPNIKEEFPLIRRTKILPSTPPKMKIKDEFL